MHMKKAKKAAKHSVGPKNTYALQKSFLPTRPSRFEFLGGLSMISVSGYSYANVIAGQRSVPRSKHKHRIAERGSGI